MTFTISESGTKEQVLTKLRESRDDSPVANMKRVLADYIDEEAADGSTVGVSISGHIAYNKRSD